MRVVLLSTLELAAGAGEPRGYLRLGGRPLVQHQLAAAIVLGCEQVFCLAEGFSGELKDLQALAEQAGLGFRIIANGHDLARLVSPRDDVLVFLDGLVASPEQLSRAIEPGPGVVVQSADQGVRAGFERIDLNHASAGLIRLPGVLLTRLTELPSDWNPVSALLRIACQAGLPQRPLPSALTAEKRWSLLRNEADAQAFEPIWLRSLTSQRARLGPGYWLAAQFVQRLGPRMLRAGTRAPLVTLAAVVLGLLGVASAWAGIHALGFLLIGIAWLTQESAALIAGVQGDAAFRRRRIRAGDVMPWMIDGFLVVCSASGLGESGSAPLSQLQSGLVAVTLIGLLRLTVPLATGRRFATWLDDRFFVSLILALLSLTGFFSTAIVAVSLLMVLLALVLVRRSAEKVTAAAGRQG